MIRFDSDYMRGALPEILERLNEINLMQNTGYGYDPYTDEAKRLILEKCAIPDGEVHFLVGGTQTNETCIDELLMPGQGVIGTAEAHINVHEAGAIEASGHKVIALPSKQGKMQSEVLNKYLTDFYADETWIHMVQPGLLYISQPTELGTLYTLAELEELSDICRKHNLKLYIDGARMAYGLASPQNDATLGDFARLADAFYIGGTKCGCLMGEAVVSKRHLPAFFTTIKRHGALLAKGWLLGVQFKILFEDGLYDKAGKNGIEKAMMLRDGFMAKGYRMAFDSPTNQQFPILPNDVLDKLRRDFTFEIWGIRGEKETTVRFVTDWGTTTAEVQSLLDALP